ncbi:hypothetical protein [Haloplasma contractile]|nr:hypothetical protein [Haloplasma contractile]
MIFLLVSPVSIFVPAVKHAHPNILVPYLPIPTNADAVPKKFLQQYLLTI